MAKKISATNKRKATPHPKKAAKKPSPAMQRKVEDELVSRLEDRLLRRMSHCPDRCRRCPYQGSDSVSYSSYSYSTYSERSQSPEESSACSQLSDEFIEDVEQ